MNNMIYPDYNTCLHLLIEEGVSEKVIKHVTAVHRFSTVIGQKFISTGYSVNMKLLEAGSLLHDIGRSRTHDISHAVEGCRIAERLNFPDDLTAIIRNHIGAGISRKEAIEKGLPAADYIPQSLEEKIVAAADNLADGEKHQTITECANRMRSRGIFEASERCLALHRELSEMCGINLDDLLTGA